MTLHHVMYAGDPHQLWTQVLQMGKQQTAADIELQQQQQSLSPTPLQRLWTALGLPAAMLRLAAAAAAVFSGAPRSDYTIACRVARFLLQGSSHLQPPKDPAGMPRLPPGGLAAAASGEITGPRFSDPGQITI